MYSTNLFHQKLAQICTNLYLTRSWHKCVQISFSQDAGKNMYKSLSLLKSKLFVPVLLHYHMRTPPPPPPHWWLAGRCCGQLHISPEMFEFPPPPPRCCRLNLRVWLAVGGGGAAVGWRSHSLSQQAVTKLYTYHCNIILALGFN